jgi:hypothetical protein
MGIVAANATNNGVKRNAKDTGTNSFGQAMGQFFIVVSASSY